MLGQLVQLMHQRRLAHKAVNPGDAGLGMNTPAYDLLTATLLPSFASIPRCAALPVKLGPAHLCCGQALPALPWTTALCVSTSSCDLQCSLLLPSIAGTPELCSGLWYGQGLTQQFLATHCKFACESICTSLPILHRELQYFIYTWMSLHMDGQKLTFGYCNRLRSSSRKLISFPGLAGLTLLAQRQHGSCYGPALSALRRCQRLRRQQVQQRRGPWRRCGWRRSASGATTWGAHL